MRALLLLLAALFHAPAALAADAGLQFAFEAGIDFGGDKVGEIYYTDEYDDDGDYRAKVYTGQGILVAFGLQYRPSRDSIWSVRSTVGFKGAGDWVDLFDDNNTSYPDGGLNRWVGEVGGRLHFPDTGVWIGVGRVGHFDIEFERGRGGPGRDFEDAYGNRFEIGIGEFGLAYTRMEYVDEFGVRYSANTLGIIGTF